MTFISGLITIYIKYVINHYFIIYDRLYDKQPGGQVFSVYDIHNKNSDAFPNYRHFFIVAPSLH